MSDPAKGGGEAVRRGTRVALDVGAVRVGVATCDPDGYLATPVTTVRRGRPAPAGGLAPDVVAITGIVAERAAIEVVVGLPTGLSGVEGSAAAAARAYAGVIARAVAPVPVRLVDERLSTVSAHRALTAAGRPGRRHRSVVDQVAAVTILQYALDAERTTSAPPGEPVVTDRSTDQTTPDG